MVSWLDFTVGLVVGVSVTAIVYGLVVAEREVETVSLYPRRSQAFRPDMDDYSFDQKVERAKLDRKLRRLQHSCSTECRPLLEQHVDAAGRRIR